MTKLTLALVLSVAIAGLSADAGAAESEEKPPVVQAAANCRPETESFDVLLDVSGSMMRVDPASDEEDRESGYSKARRFLMRLAGDADMSIPSGLATIGPFTERLPAEIHDAQEFRDAVEALPEKLETAGRMTWLGKRAKKFLAGTPNQESRALLLITDGAFTKWHAEEKVDPREAFQAFREANEGNRLHLLLLTHSDELRRSAAEIIGAEPTDLDQLLTDNAKYAAFIERVFRSRCTEPVPPEIELQGIVFDFDSYALTAESREILDRALEILRTRPDDEPFEIEGWTDYMGSDAYNMKLSASRARSVRDYFAAHGIDPARMTIQGRGKSFKYDNSTSRGRHQNRRVVLILGKGTAEEKVSTDNPGKP